MPPRNKPHKYSEATFPLFIRWIRRTYRLGMHSLGYKLRRYNEQYVPERGSAIVVAPHRSIWDPLVVLWALQHRAPGIVGKKSLFRVPVLSLLLYLLDVMPVPHGRKAKNGEHQGKMKDKVRLRIEKKIFGRGRMFLIFPEGGVYHQDYIENLLGGAVSMALRYNVSLLPLGLGGVEKGFRTHTLAAVFGEPIDVKAWFDAQSVAGLPEDVNSRRELYAKFNNEVLVPAMQVAYDRARAAAGEPLSKKRK